MAIKLILSDKIENFDKTSAVNAIRFTLYDDNGIYKYEIEKLFENILKEKVLKICFEEDYDWQGRKFALDELIRPKDFIDNDGSIKKFASKSIIEYFISYWETLNPIEPTGIDIDNIKLLKKFIHS